MMGEKKLTVDSGQLTVVFELTIDNGQLTIFWGTDVAPLRLLFQQCATLHRSFLEPPG